MEKGGGFAFFETAEYVPRTYETCCKSSKVDKKKVYPHAFRHFYAKQYLEKNGGERALGELKMILGHSDIKTTMIYLEYNDEEIAEKMARSRNR